MTCGLLAGSRRRVGVVQERPQNALLDEDEAPRRRALAVEGSAGQPVRQSRVVYEGEGIGGHALAELALQAALALC